MAESQAGERRHPEGEESRSPYERDRDRVLYTSALRRLAETTQVYPSSTGHIYHNRLTHTLEVAQLARRIAERHATGTDPAACEAAAWAHDLGHPPFGHNGEGELDRVLREMWPAGDGYEGNAQSFRAVVRLAVRREVPVGLNLTRASLRGVLKYPWLRGGRPGDKFGAYRTEAEELEWAMSGLPSGRPSPEAQVVDFADDVAYSVHDLFDFTRARLIPLHELRKGGEAWHRFLDAAGLDEGGSREVFEQWVRPFPLTVEFDGSRNHRAGLRAYTSGMIGRLVKDGVRAEPGRLLVAAETQAALTVLKQLTVQFVMLAHDLAPVKERQRSVVAQLAAWFADAGGRNLPVEAREQFDAGQPLDRSVADAVASLTESEAEHLVARLRAGT